MLVKKCVFQSHGDLRGQLIALEEGKDIPFTIRRVFYMFDTSQGVVRGQHAHKSLEQVLVCVHGSCKVRLDNGIESQVVTLDTPCEGIIQSKNVWGEMFDFSEGAVLLVLASELYDENEYIRDYSKFLEWIRTAGA